MEPKDSTIKWVKSRHSTCASQMTGWAVGGGSIGFDRRKSCCLPKICSYDATYRLSPAFFMVKVRNGGKLK